MQRVSSDISINIVNTKLDVSRDSNKDRNYRTSSYTKCYRRNVNSMDLNDQNKTELVVLHQNICSIKNKVEELELFVDTLEHTVDILCISEHWLKQGHQRCNYN